MVVHENALKHALAAPRAARSSCSPMRRATTSTEVLRAMGLARYFDAVYTIEDARYRGKPALHGFRMLLRKHNLDPHRCAFVDDMLENLRTAHRLGMSTVWVSRENRRTCLRRLARRFGARAAALSLPLRLSIESAASSHAPRQRRTQARNPEGSRADARGAEVGAHHHRGARRPASRSPRPRSTATSPPRRRCTRG